MLKSLSGELTGSGRSSRTSTRVNTAVVEPMLSASVTRTVAVKTGSRSNNRMPKRTS
jgi:hypothetical protein